MARIALLVAALFLLPAVVPLAQAGGTYRFDAWTSTNRPDGEFLLGDTITFEFRASSSDTSFTFKNYLYLYQGNSLRATLGDGSTVTVAPGQLKLLRWTWSTSTLGPSYAGEWKAVVDTPDGAQSLPFDLSHTPDFRVSWMRLSHDAFLGLRQLRDGHEKILEACIENVGPEEASSVTVGAYFRLLVDPLLSGQRPLAAAPAAPDWRDGHVVATKTVALDAYGFPNRCDAHGISKPGYYVRFEVDVSDLSPLLQGAPGMTRVGVRADALDAVWEIDESNNAREEETTIMPWTFLP